MPEVNIVGYIVPWALPNETIPLHVSWGSDVYFDEVRVKLPSDFKVIDILNVNEVEVKEHEVMITRVKPPREGVPSYFGMVVSSTKIFDKLGVARKIIIEFIRNKQTFYCLELHGRIFRPYLEVMEFPKEIDLFDQPEKNKLPLHLRYSGFGDIDVKIEAKIGGEIVSIGESIVYEIMKRLWLSDVIEKTLENSVTFADEERERRKRELWINPAYIRTMAQELEETIEKGIIPTEHFDAAAIADLKEWLSDVKSKDKFMEILYEKTESILFDLLVDLFDKNPTDNVKLANAKITIRTRIKTPVTKIDVKILYKDKLGNEYPPIEIPIHVQDRRSQEGGMLVEMPIRIEKWQSEPFMNVEKMKILEEG